MAIAVALRTAPIVVPSQFSRLAPKPSCGGGTAGGEVRAVFALEGLVNGGGEQEIVFDVVDPDHGRLSVDHRPIGLLEDQVVSVVRVAAALSRRFARIVAATSVASAISG